MLLTDGTIVKMSPYKGDNIRYPYTDAEAKAIILASLNDKLID